MDGEGLMDWLRKQYHLELEMCGVDYVVAITTIMDSEKGLRRLEQAFLEIDGQLQLVPEDPVGVSSVDAEVTMPVWQAVDAPCEKVMLVQAAGRISAEFVYVYPPGIPVIVPGERISGEMTALIQDYKNRKLSVQGMADPGAEWIQVI